MVKVESHDQLIALRDRLREDIESRRAEKTRILVGMGTCGIAAGAREVMDALRLELKTHGIDAELVSVGCIGICQSEPLVDIEQPGMWRVTYQNVQADMVPRLVNEHLVNHRVVSDWAVGRLHPDGIEPPASSGSTRTEETLR